MPPLLAGANEGICGENGITCGDPGKGAKIPSFADAAHLSFLFYVIIIFFLSVT